MTAPTPQIPQTDPRHGSTSASSAGADALCAGRHQAQAGLPEVQTENAAAGTRIHAALATGDPKGLSLEETEMFDSCRKVEAKLVTQGFGVDAKPLVIREQRLWMTLTRGDQKIAHSGQPDVVYRVGPKLMILDFKTGPSEVAESSTNHQLRDLSVLAVASFGAQKVIITEVAVAWFGAQKAIITEVAVAVIQPLVTYSPEVCVYEAEDLTRAAKEMAARVIASNTPGAKRAPGAMQCKYCRAAVAGKCPEYQAWATSMVPAPRSILDVPVAQWTGGQCALFLDNAGIAQKWLDGCNEAIKARVKADANAVPGWGFKPGAVLTPITDPQACFDRFAALGGKLEQFLKTVEVGKGKLKEQLNIVTGARGQALDKAVKALCEGIVESKQNAPSLVKVESK